MGRGGTAAVVVRGRLLPGRSGSHYAALLYCLERYVCPGRDACCGEREVSACGPEVGVWAEKSICHKRRIEETEGLCPRHSGKRCERGRAGWPLRWSISITGGWAGFPEVKHCVRFGHEVPHPRGRPTAWCTGASNARRSVAPQQKARRRSTMRPLESFHVPAGGDRLEWWCEGEQRRCGGGAVNPTMSTRGDKETRWRRAYSRVTYLGRYRV